MATETSNIEIAAQLLAMNEKIAAQLEKQTKSMQTQTQLMIKLASSNKEMRGTNADTYYSNLSSSLDDANEAAEKWASKAKDVKGMSDAIDLTKQKLSSLSQVSQGFFARLRKNSDAFFVAEQGILGFANGIGFMLNAAKTGLSLLAGLGKVIFNLGASILLFPFKVLGNLIKASQQGGSNELATELEAIRTEFGYLNKTAGGAIVSLGRSMQGNLAETGLSVYRVFGNLAQRLKFVAEYAKNLGSVFDALRFTVGTGGAEALGAYNKGLGLTAEGQKAIAVRALSSGRTVNEVNRQIANYAIQLSSAFGVTMKEVSRDIGSMMADFQHFGHLAPQQLAQVSVYTRRLGLDVKALGAMMDKTFNFEDAANQAAQLSQAFGINIDAIEQMKEQDSGRQLDNLRKAFFAAGRSVDNMTRQERALLASQTGLDAASIDAAFSLKNQGISYDQIQKKGDLAKKSQISQAEAMQKLAGAIERLVQSGSTSGGFFDQFFKGFNRGLTWSREWRGLMRNLSIDLRSTLYAGMRVGRMFVEYFPGVKQIFGSLRDLFNPTRFRAMLSGVTDAFRHFFKDMTENPAVALPKLLERLKITFFSFLDRSSPAGAHLLDGLKSFFGAIATIAKSMLKIALEGITTGLRVIIDLLTGRTSIPTGSGSGALAGYLRTSFTNLKREFGPILSNLWGAIKELFTLLWDRVKPWLTKGFAMVVKAALTAAISRAVLAGIAGSLAKGFVGIASGGLNGSIKNMINAREATRARTSADLAPTAIPGLQAASAAGPEVANAQRATAGVQPGAGWGAKFATMAMVVAGMAVLLAELVILALVIQRNNIKPEALVAAAGIMGAMSIVMLILTGAIKVLEMTTINKGSLLSIAVGLVAVGVVGFAIASFAKLMVNKFANISLENIAKTSIIMVGMGVFFLAVAGLVAVAVSIGTVIIGSLGAGYGALIIGLSAVALTVEEMVRNSMVVANAINQFNPSGGVEAFTAKSKAFAAIIGAIGSFVGNIASLMVALRPSFFTFSDEEEQFRSNMRTASNFITQISGNMQGLIIAVVASAQQLSGGEESLKKAEILGTILNAVANLAKSLQGSAEMASSPDFLSTIRGATTTNNIIAMQNYFTNAYVSMRDLMIIIVERLIPQITRLNLSEGQVKSAEAVAGLMTGLADIAKALIPSGDLMKNVKGDNLAAYNRNIIQPLIDGLINSNLISNIGTAINSVITSISNSSFTKSQLDVIRVVLPAMSAAMSAIGSMGQLISNGLGEAQQGTTNNARRAALSLRFIRELFGTLEQQLPTLMTSIINTFSGRGMNLDAITRAVKGIDALKSIIDISATVSALKADAGNELGQGFVNLQYVLNRLQVGFWFINHQLSGNTGFATLVTRLDRAIRTIGFRHVSNTVKGMVDDVNLVSTSLRNLQPLTIDTDLQRLANNLGLGSNREFTINRGAVNIHANFEIKINADDLEYVLINRTGANIATIRSRTG